MDLLMNPSADEYSTEDTANLDASRARNVVALS
jgi:hypothetical protein